MTDQQIETLRQLLASGQRIGWRDRSGPMREIVSIGMRGESPQEPSGNFRDGTYCALWAVCPEDVVAFVSVFGD